MRSLALSYCRLFSAGVAALSLAACTVGPDYEPPGAPAADAYTVPTDTDPDAAGDDDAGAEADIPHQAFVRAERVRTDWYRLFGSTTLDRLIGQALDNSPSLAAGRARLAAARAAVDESKADLYPQLDVGAGYSRRRVTGAAFGINDPSFTNVFNFYEARANASYDLDLFGKTRRRIEAAGARLNEQRYRVIDTYVTLINNIVTTAIAEAGINDALSLTRQLAESQAKALDIVGKRIRYGAAIDADAAQLKTQLARTRAALVPLEKQKALAVDRLAVLTGTPPGQFDDPNFTLDDLALPKQLPVTLPGRLVRQRPDILASQAAVHAASAKIGVATANLLPDLTISGSYSRQALSPADVGDPINALYTLGAQIAAPIFSGGRLRAQKRQAQQLYIAALADYRATALAAFGDVANALHSLDADERALAARQTELDTARTNLQTVRTQLRYGSADYIALYTVEAQYEDARRSYSDARVMRYRDTADLFHALGGGWTPAQTTSKNTSASAPAPASTSTH